MIKAAVITSVGLEDTASVEIKELIKAKTVKKEETIVIFDVKNMLELAKICYRSQSISRALLLLGEFGVDQNLEKTMKSLAKTVEKSDFHEFLKKYRIDTERHGEHDFKSIDITSSLNPVLQDEARKKYKAEIYADYDSAEVIFYVYIQGKKGYFGIDFAGIDLAKRQYKIFNHPESLKGTTGYLLVKEAGVKKGVILDPFMGSGVIVIEAALHYAGFPVQYYSKDKLAFTRLEFFEKEKDKFFEKEDLPKDSRMTIIGYDCEFRYLKACQKNAKLAGIDKYLTLSRIESEWLDTKFEYNAIDAIITDPPRESKHKDEKMLMKVYSEFFHNSSFILKKKGKIVMIAIKHDLLDEAAKKNKFKISKNYLANQGKESFNIIVYEKV